jgi:ferric-dicitrate binding protein FerR (iron transport regulator)
MPVSRELRYLLEKQLEGRLTAEERSRFLYLLRQSQNRLMLEDNIEALLHQQRYHDSATPDKQALFEQVMREANEPATAPQEAPVIVLHSKWRRRLSYAAAIIIILLVATWYLTNTSTKQQHPIATTTIQPKDSGQAANKVLLTLADGTQVAVDEVRDGDINNGLGAHIKKQQGLIVFNPSTAANAANEYNTISTTRGKQYHIILPDKTQVWLNAASSLKFPVAFNGKERKVALIGEGYFEVTKNPKQPFIVIANDTKVRVLGTHFNVMAYTNEGAVKTTLLEGSVEVGNRQSAIGSRKSLILKPGEQAIDRPDSKMTIDRSPNLEQTMAWKNGEFRFENTGIETIMRQVERWYNLDVVYKGAIPTDLGLSGVIAQTEKVTQLLDILEATHRVRFSVEGNKIIVMPYQTK